MAGLPGAVCREEGSLTQMHSIRETSARQAMTAVVECIRTEDRTEDPLLLSLGRA